LTPPTSDSGPPNADTNDHGSDSDPDLPPRKKRAPVPVDKKDDRYWERRKKNNIAAKRSRELRRKKIDDELKQAQDAIQENQKLKQEIEVLKAEINSLRRLLKDANMTLSLWIRAKQTAEPNSQLPPMLRGPNVPFVNFPVSSNV
jgi:peptidoglycan hydrolase CwlO-like protein